MQSNTLTEIEYVKNRLNELNQKLTEVKQVKTHGINIFDAIDMRNREIKHSAFLAWLINPNQTHKLGSAFLTLFLQKLLVHGNKLNEALPAENTNAEILAEKNIKSINDLKEFISDEHLTVETEKVLFDKDSRMDIYINSPSTKTTLVIENKIFTSTHGNQLRRYEDQCEKSDSKKNIYVYLTPEGSAPIDLDENAQNVYRGNWCVFSYYSIVEITKKLLETLPKTKENAKLRILTEDYIEMIDVNVLKENKELKALCKQIRREHKDALDLLLFYTDNTEHTFTYCKNWLKLNVKNLTVVKDTATFFDFYTDATANYFKNQNESIAVDEKRVKCRYCLVRDNSVAGGICMDKSKENVWTLAQLKIARTFAPDKPLGNLYFSIKDYNVKFISEEDSELEFESLKSQIDESLKKYADNLKAFEDKLLSI